MESKKDHLVILVHGLHGGADDLEYIRICLEGLYPNIIGYCAKSNAKSPMLTHEGIEKNGMRVYNEIMELIQDPETQDIKYFSIIGHSLGGLIARYAIGKLYEENFFQKYTPVNYISVATPHVGSRRSPRTVYNRLFGLVLSKVFSETGRELTLHDATDERPPLLVEMTLPDSTFFKGLSLFPNLVAYANVKNDMSVPFCTASIVARNPYIESKEKLVFSEKYAHIIEDHALATEDSMLASLDDAFMKDSKRNELITIVKNLNKLKWKRVSVYFDSWVSYLSHEVIVAKREWMQTENSVIQHMVDHFLTALESAIKT